jgi:hypothetical protein
MPDAQVVSVEIRGQRYPIESDLDAKYVNGLASYLERRFEPPRNRRRTATRFG